MTQPWSNPAVNLIIITSGAPNTGLFLYQGTPAAGNPPVLWAVAPGVTSDPFGNTVTPVLGAGNPTGANTQIDAAGDVTLTGASGTQLALNPAAGLPFSLTSTLTGIMQTVMSLGSGDSNQTQAGIVSGIQLGTGATAKVGTLVMSPYVTTGMGLLLQAVNDGGTDTASALVGTVTTQTGSVTFTPSFAVYPSALIAYTGGGAVTVVTKTGVSSGTIPIPANAATTALGEAWGRSGTGANGASTTGGGGGGGGEYAAEPALVITPGGTVAWSIPASGATTLTGAAVTVTANAGGNAVTGTGGAGGTGSANTTHHNGGAGGNRGTAGAGGGGSSAGPSAVGGAGHNGSGTTGGAGGTAPSGGGPGGKGGNINANGAAGTAPGGGPGGGGASGNAGATTAGQTKLTYTAGSFTVLWSVSNTAFTDQFGNSILTGERVRGTGADTNVYRTERLTSLVTADQLINSTTGQNITNMSGLPVRAGTYRITGQLYWQQTTSSISQSIKLQAASPVSGTRLMLEGLPLSGTAVSYDFINEIIDLTAQAFGGTVTNAAVHVIHIEGTVVFSANDTMGLVGIANSAVNTWTVKAGSWLELMPVTP